LPSDENFKKLTDFQINWILDNIKEDAELEQKSLERIEGVNTISTGIKDLGELLDSIKEMNDAR